MVRKICDEGEERGKREERKVVRCVTGVGEGM